MMRRWCSAVVAGVLGVFSAAPASAEVSAPADPSARIFDDAGFNAANAKAARAEIAIVERDCSRSEMMREGPSPEEMARCQAATAKLTRRGVAAVGPILAALDEDGASWNVRNQLYQILARTHDTRLVEPLVRGMARIAMRKLPNREWEADLIHEALVELTRAPVSEVTPWARGTLRSARQEQISRVVDWRLWLEENRGASHAELASKRLEDERAHVEDADPARAFRAARYLLTREPAEGLLAVGKVAGRPDLPKDGQNELDWRAEQAREQVALDKKKRPAPAAKKQPAPAQKRAPMKKLPPPRSEVLS